MRPILTVAALSAALALVGCGGSSDPRGTEPVEQVDPPQPDDGVAAIAAALPGCDLAATTAPEVAAALAETVRTDAVVGPAVLTDDDDGGRTLTVTLVVAGGAAYRPVSWVVVDGDGAPRLLPLTDAALEVSPADVDRSRLLGADEELVLGDTPGTGGMAVGQDCSLILAQELVPRPPPPPPAFDDGIVVTPQTVTPGTVVEVTFPGRFERGIAYQFDQEVDGKWVTRWWSTSDADGGEPITVPSGTDGYAVHDVGVGGSGPDRVLVDPATAPGSYRLCTANARDDICAALEVAAG